MDLEAKKRELADMQAELVNLESRYSREQDNNTLGRQIDSLKNDITKLSGEIDILQNMDLLEKKYSNSEPINFYYVDSDGLSDYIELTSGDVNYDRAYQQQRDLLQLEYNHYNKLPLSYVVRDNRGFLEGVVNSGNDKYDEVYNRKKNEILQMNILKPDMVLLDEIDSGLDVDSLKLVGEAVMEYYEKRKPAILLVTHYQRLLDYIKPDFIHIMQGGKIVKSGDKSLALRIEKEGYDKIVGMSDE